MNITGFIEYLEATTDDQWCTEICRTPDGKQNCIFGHLMEWGGPNAYDEFQERYATTYMAYPVNDGEHPDYPQATPKLRVVAYINDLIAGKQPTTYQLMEQDAGLPS